MDGKGNVFFKFHFLKIRCAQGIENAFLILSTPDTILKGVLLGLRRFLATEIPLKIMKNAFYFTSKALFVLKIFKCLS